MKKSKKPWSASQGSNRKKMRPAASAGFLSAVSKRSHEKTNRRLYSRGKPVWAALSAEEFVDDSEALGFLGHFLRFLLGCFLLPFCWMTTWVFLQRFSEAALEQGFWHSQQFWYFAVGAVLMLGWFFSKIGQSAFLYCYVFGHELTHAVFVKFFGGKVLDIDWSSEGGYVTTDKSNWLISLSPYFVPFWSIIALIVYLAVSLVSEIKPMGNQIFYGVIGATWSFHLAWTLWMIPRDQPDLKDNGTFLSLVLIYFGNLIVLILLLCCATPAPLESLRDFGYSWFGTALTWGDTSLRWAENFLRNYQ
jgi:hypothetical protein